MSEVTQRTATIAITTTLGPDELILDTFKGTEELGRLFSFEAVMVSSNGQIDPDAILGTNVTVRMQAHDDTTRYFNGYVSEFASMGATERFSRYRLVMKPWLWFLDQTTDCRIFQETSIRDVITTVFEDLGFMDFQLNLKGSYEPVEYCVQYRETAFNFVSRLMEKDGIYYYFEHENGKHTLVLCDEISSHSTMTGYADIPYFLPATGRARDFIHSWFITRSLRPTMVELTDYDFKKPKTDLLSRAQEQRDYQSEAFHQFDYPGSFATVADGERYARIALEEQQAKFSLREGAGNARGIAPGYLFKLTDHPQDDQNAEYLIVKAEYDINPGYFENVTERRDNEDDCNIRFTAMSSAVPYRSARVTQWPVVHGPQSAMVVGPAGEEIHTDEHGRVKVHFYWDRASEANEQSSCWMRVVQRLAGQKYGAIYLPRIGQECIVEFMHGNPDQPVVTGSLYNGDNQPPYELPANKSVSGIKTNSTTGGAGNNEIRFEDKKGEEQLFMQAERNLDVHVKNSRFESVGTDRHLTIGKDKHEHVKGERHEIVDKDHYELIKGVQHAKVEKSQATDVTETLTLTVGKDVSETFKANHSMKVTQDSYIKANNIVIEAQMSITINVGGTYIAIDNTGVKISAPQIEFDAKMELKGKGGMTTKFEGGIAAELKGGAMTTISGGIVKIN